MPPFVERRAHGGLLDDELARLGIHPDEVLDVSVNVNPYGPCPAVVAAVRAARVDRYPDPTAQPAREAIARATDTDPRSIVVGNGAVDLLWTIVRALLPAGRVALVVEPAFSEFAAAVKAAGSRVVSWRALAEADFCVDLDRVGDVAAREKAEIVYVCTPANPTGVALEAASLAAFAAAHPALLFVVDESFGPLSERFDDQQHVMPDNVVRVRSMTKEHALPGVRVGYLVARRPIAACVEAARPPWTTSAFAQAAAIAALGERAFVIESRMRALDDRRRLVARLRDIGYSPFRSSTLFFLVPVRDGASTRARLLARHRVLVRDCASFGLPGFVRICAQPPSREARLLEALRDEGQP
ncbi:MAG: histidinol-phosphate transaminase [Polyangiaceae bacterium]|jgi:histidinol-phosphate/aromatic aminotransferase/cobyric acid decarboxylase-like protein